MDGTGPLRHYEDPLEWIRVSDLYKRPETLPKGKVIATQYLFVREEDDKIVGMIQIRHYFNDYLAKYAGHIGYSVAPSERRKGYASLMLKTALPFCRKIGLDRVLITCNKDNEGSRRTILKNGGKYDGTVYEPDEGVDIERYWIDLTEI
ncbi:MAG: GNAT family N-acetyltransferase [Clostridia bacterium]|nr:GNAT family N-acetyltransferase [Clostridia bacterium]